MMSFERMEDTLLILKKQESVTLEDALGLFLDLCEDIKGSGQTIESLDISESDRLLTNLSRSGRIFLRIMKKKAEDIRGIDISARIQKQEEQIALQIDQLRVKEKELEEYREQLEQAILDMEKKKQQYQGQQLEADEKRKQLDKLTQECQNMRTEIDSIEQLSLGSLEQKKRELEKQKSDLERRLGGKEKELKILLTELQEVEQTCLAKQNLMVQKEMELQKLHREEKTLEDSIVAKADAINQAKESLQEKQETAAVLREQQSRLNGDVVMIQNEIDRLKEHLTNSDAAKLQTERSRLLQEKLQVDEKMEQERLALETVRKTLVDSRDEMQLQRDRFEKERSILLDQTLQMKERLRALEEQIQAGKTEKNQLEQRLSDAEEQYRHLKEWFESLEIKRYTERLNHAEQKIRIFQEVQRELFYETEELGLLQGMTNQEANKKREELRRQMEEIEDKVEDYRRKYNIICGLFSD